MLDNLHDCVLRILSNHEFIRQTEVHFDVNLYRTIDKFNSHINRMQGILIYIITSR